MWWYDMLSNEIDSKLAIEIVVESQFGLNRKWKLISQGPNWYPATLLKANIGSILVDDVTYHHITWYVTSRVTVCIIHNIK